MSLLITAQPTVEPVTVDEVKARLRLTTTEDDALIAAHIATARDFAESQTGWSLAAKSYRMIIDGFPVFPDYIVLLRPPLVTIDSVEYLDPTYAWQTWDPTQYWCYEDNRPAILERRDGVTYPTTARARGTVRINYTTGAYADFLPHIEGIREIAVHLYDHPEAITAEGLKEMPTGFSTFFKTKRAHCEI
jgi:uncharacterized phiE125 gp8 family phage protein